MKKENTNPSPIRHDSITTQFVNLLPFPIQQFLPIIHRFIPTFSPILRYTEGCKNESGEMNTPEGVRGVEVGGGNNLMAYRSIEKG